MEMDGYGVSQTGIRIGDKHTFQDWGLLLISISISSPEAKTKVIEIPGGDGCIDLTEAFGPVRYKNRTIVCSFILIDRRPDRWHEVSSQIKNYCHGKKMKVIMDSDPGYYWEEGSMLKALKKIKSTAPLKLLWMYSHTNMNRQILRNRGNGIRSVLYQV